MFHIIPSILKLSRYTITKINASVGNLLNSKYYSTSEPTATFDIKPYKLHNLEAGPPQTSVLTKTEAIYFFFKMTLMRQLENAASGLYKEKLIRGFLHLYSGQEAVASGIRSKMRKTDTVITSYRCHTWNYLMGVPAKKILSELTGRVTGCVRGKGGSMHMYSPNCYGGQGIVGGQLPLGTGLGLAHKYQGNGGVSFVVYGDGAANHGQLFESFNMAKLWSLPCVYVCENNKYGMGTSVPRASACTLFYTRGDYVPGIWVDGMDVNATREATQFAINYCTSGKGPIVLEMDTYRYFGHSMSDPGKSYRTRDEVQTVRETSDPINTFKDKILKAGLVTEEELKKLKTEATKEVKEAIKSAKSDPTVGVEELSFDIYKLCLEPEQKIRGCIPDSFYTHKLSNHSIA